MGEQKIRQWRWVGSSAGPIPSWRDIEDGTNWNCMERDTNYETRTVYTAPTVSGERPKKGRCGQCGYYASQHPISNLGLPSLSPCEEWVAPDQAVSGEPEAELWQALEEMFKRWDRFDCQCEDPKNRGATHHVRCGHPWMDQSIQYVRELTSDFFPLASPAPSEPREEALITKGWMLKGPDNDQGTWQGWRIHANEGEGMVPVKIVAAEPPAETP